MPKLKIVSKVYTQNRYYENISVGVKDFFLFFFKPFHPLMTHPLRNLISVVANSLTAGLGRF